MANVTYYVVLPFVRTEEGDLCAEEAIEVQSAGSAQSKARLIAAGKAGVVAFSRSGDPNTGEFTDAVIIARFGDVPEDVAALGAA